MSDTLEQLEARLAAVEARLAPSPLAVPPVTVGELTDVPAPGSPIASAWAQEVSNRIIHRFATVAALTAWAAADGSAAYVTATKVHYLRVGGVWVALGGYRDWVPTVAQGAPALTLSTATARVQQTGQLVVANFATQIATGTGAAATSIVCGLPVPAQTPSPNTMMGHGFMSHGAAVFIFYAIYSDATHFALLETVGGGSPRFLGSAASGMTAGIAVGDTVTATLTYEAKP